MPVSKVKRGSVFVSLITTCYYESPNFIVCNNILWFVYSMNSNIFFRVDGLRLQYVRLVQQRDRELFVLLLKRKFNRVWRDHCSRSPHQLNLICAVFTFNFIFRTYFNTGRAQLTIYFATNNCWAPNNLTIKKKNFKTIFDSVFDLVTEAAVRMTFYIVNFATTTTWCIASTIWTPASLLRDPTYF